MHKDELDEADDEMNQKRQQSVMLQANTNEASFNAYLEKKERENQTFQLRNQIDNDIKQMQQLFRSTLMQLNSSDWRVTQAQGYEMFFNYDLNTVTWRNFVNKMILMTYHRLLIEK